MPKEGDKRWVPTLNGGALRKSRGIVAAEPKHRIGPQGSSTGQSVRKFPKSCVQQVRDICLHYVEKCSGKYENNKMAARYLHQMAEEVMSQLSGVAAQIKRHEAEPEVFQALLDEWNNAFPASLGAMGSPKHVAATLQQQSKDIEELRDTLEAERKSKSKDVADVLRSMDAQLQSSRQGIITERRQLNVIQQQEVERYQALLTEAEHKLQDGIEEAIRTMKVEVDAARAQGENMVRAEKAHMEEVAKKFRVAEINHKRELDMLASAKEGEKDELRREIRKLEAEVKRLADQLDAIMMFNPNEESRSMAPSEPSELDEPDFEALVAAEEAMEEEEEDEDDEEEEDEEEEEEEEEDEQGEEEEDDEDEAVVSLAGSSASAQARYAAKVEARLERRRLAELAREERRLAKLRLAEQKRAKKEALEKRRADKMLAKAAKHKAKVEAKRAAHLKAREAKAETRKIEKMRRSAASSSSNVVRGMQEFKNQIASLAQKLKQTEEQNEALTAELNKTLAEKVVFKRQLENQLEVNEGIRQALGSQIRYMPATSAPRDIHLKIVEVPRPLTHTPHFLHHSDTTGVMRNTARARMSATSSSGRF